MNLRNVNVGDRIKVVDTYEGEVTHVGQDGAHVTIGNRYCLSSSYGNDDDPQGLVRAREVTMIKEAVPDILPTGTVVYYHRRGTIADGLFSLFVQTDTGWQDLTSPATKGANLRALAEDVRAGKAEIRYRP